MTKRVLITGGAGFIGSHLADELLRSGYEVRALDALEAQVHPDGKRPEYLGKPDLRPEVTGKARAGDIRHCFADISLARDLLGFEPEVELEDGMADLADWLAGQAAVDRVDDANVELAARGLTR